MLSVSKILLIIAVAGAVFAVTKLLRGTRTPARRQEKDRPQEPADPAIDAVDLARCETCGQYAADGSGPCEREDCPRAA